MDIVKTSFKVHNVALETDTTHFNVSPRELQRHTHKQILILQVYFLLQAGTLVFRSHSRAVNAPSLSVPIHLGSSCQTDTLIHFSLPGKKTSKKLRNETSRE